MKFNLKDNLKVHTCYTFELMREGKCIQKEQTHNVLCKTLFNGGSSGLSSCQLYVGSGAGTPSYNDTALFNRLWNAAFSKDSADITYGDKTADTDAFVKVALKYTIPATSTYVGNITECGLYSGGLYSHAMLLDAEGNPITIEKTDLDILVVTVEVTFNCIETDTIKFVPMKYSPLCMAFKDDGTLINWLNPRVAVLWSVEESKTAGLFPTTWGGGSYGYKASYYTPANASHLPGATTSHANRVMKVSNARLGSTFPDNEQLFIKGLLVSNFFIIPFPNTDIFPVYTISNIDVGVGDGSATEFVCPLNYFMKDTDKVYINGVLKTRGVDYILDNENNNQAISTLMAANEAIITGGTASASYPCLPVFRSVKTPAKVTGYSNYGFYVAYNACNYPDSFSTEAPLFFDMQKDVRVNYLQIGAPYSGGTASGGVVYTVWYLDENEEWIECGKVSKPDNNNKVSVIFDTVTARYFKVTINYATNPTANLTSNYYSAYSSSSTCSSDGDGSAYPIPLDKLCMLGYKGQGIVFTNPPAAGDIITMEADLDLPMKNGNFVFDVDLTLTY